jgi:DNA-binding transcriptional MerR regulator
MRYQTIGSFAKQFGLSRGTLLYYDRIGLLKPAGSSEAGYRLYGERELARMQRIDAFRQAGLQLTVIRAILEDESENRVSVALEQRLAELNGEVRQLRAQQRLVVELLRRQGAQATAQNVDVEQWVAMLSEAGIDEQGLVRWHTAFERESPDAHQAFLESLGLPDREIVEIRCRSRSKSASNRM